jgi:choline dehydrogenase
MTTRKGRRCSAAVAYLRPAENRKNLDVVTEAKVLDVCFDGQRACGVTAMIKGRPTTLTARREIILCAGAIASPQLLMLSGVGPADELQTHGLAVRHALSGVGENLQDHLQARPIFRCRTSTINVETKTLLQKAMIALRYAVNRSGPMSMAASLGAAFFRSRPELETPDIQFHIQPFSKDNVVVTHDFSAFTASVCQLRPESTGRVTLKSAVPADYPSIHPNYLSTRTDCETLVEGIRIARRIAQCEPLKSLVTSEHVPGADVGDAHEEILDWARSNATTIFHPTGTCKMGRDAMAVVDERLTVHGISGLRVADCSIMPKIVSGNTNATAIMIGEKAATMILEDTRRG